MLLIYPLVVYAAAALYAALAHNAFMRSWGTDALNTTSFLAFVLLGNFAHNFVSFWQLIRVPEYYEWTKLYRWRGFSIWQITIVAFALIAAVVFWLPRGFTVFETRVEDAPIPTALIFLFLFVNAHHTLAQTRGIGIGLSHRYQIKTDDDRNRYAEYTRAEVVFYRALIADWFVYFAWALLFKKPFWLYFVVGRVTLLVGLYVWMALAHRKLGETHAKFKLLFHARHLYRLFFGLHPIVTYIAFGLHGADAMLTYWKAVGKSSAEKKWLIKTEFAGLYLAIGIYFFFIYRFYPTTAFMNRLLGSVFVTHYVVEGFMYRMKDPTTRKLIGPLL